MAPGGAGIRSWEERCHDGAVGFGLGITLGKAELFDVVARCEDAVELAEAADQSEIAFVIEGVRRFLLDRLTGGRDGLDD